jgi:hypothetical protein
VRLACLALVAAALAGCSSIDYHTPAPADWPDLMPIEHHVSHAEMRERCMPFMAWYESPEACAIVQFVERRCDIWLSADFPPGADVIEHERAHCAGRDHPGDSTLRDAWRAYQGRS